VPVRIKSRIADLFMSIPHKAKAKVKVPFERLVTADIHDKRKRRLVNRTTKELLHANQDHALCPTQDTQAKVAKLKTSTRRYRATGTQRTRAHDMAWAGLSSANYYKHFFFERELLSHWFAALKATPLTIPNLA
jgi:hypothetical protein